MSQHILSKHRVREGEGKVISWLQKAFPENIEVACWKEILHHLWVEAWRGTPPALHLMCLCGKATFQHFKWEQQQRKAAKFSTGLDFISSGFRLQREVMQPRLSRAPSLLLPLSSQLLAHIKHKSLNYRIVVLLLISLGVKVKCYLVSHIWTNVLQQQRHAIIFTTNTIGSSKTYSNLSCYFMYGNMTFSWLVE